MAAEDHLGKQFDRMRGTKSVPFVGLANNGEYHGGSAHPRPDLYNVTGYRMLRPGDEDMIHEQTAHMPWISNN